MFWYHYLNNPKEKNLLSERRCNEDSLVICWQREKRQYNMFENYISFLKFQKEIETNNIVEKCFYEIMLPGKPRKIYFDIDIELDDSIFNDIEERDIIKTLKEAIFTELDNKEITILVFNSHTETKFSYHLVLPDFCVSDEKACLNFYKAVIEKVPESYHQFIDNSVYKNTQQFRLLGSHKFGKSNTKIFNGYLSHNYLCPERYFKKEAKNNYLFWISLVSKTSTCTLLNEYNYKEKKKDFISLGTANTSDVDTILDVFYRHETYKFTYDDFVHLNTIEKNGNLILTFRRQNPTYCSWCKRVHENENPFLVVRGIEREIYYYCRRSDNKGFLLGKLGQYHLTEEEQISINDVTILNNEPEIEENEACVLMKKTQEKPVKRKPKIWFPDNIRIF